MIPNVVVPKGSAPLLLLVFSPAETTPPLWLGLTLAGVYLPVLLLIAEAVGRWPQAIDREISRKIVHIGSGNVLLLAWWFAIPAWIAIAASIVAGTLALVSFFVPLLPSIESVGRKSLGTFFYAASIGILVGWFWAIGYPHEAVIGILVMTWGDGLAALVGQNFGRHHYQVWGATKSWEGSLAMAIASFVVCAAILLAVHGSSWEAWTIPAVVAIAATGLESLSILGIDNLTVPIASAALCFLLERGTTLL